MNKRLILLVMLMQISIMLPAVTQTDWQKNGLQGKVKSVTSSYETLKYNQQGYLTSITYGDEYSFSGDTIITYDSSNRVLSRVSHNPYHEENDRITTNYDANGLLIKTDKRGSLGDEMDVTEYNSKKQLSWKKTYDDANSLTDAIEYIYDAAGNKIRENNYNEDMEIYSFTEYDYDKDNRLVEKRDFDNYIPELPETIYRYNAQGLVKEEINFYAGQIDTQKRLSYDKYGNLTKEETNYGEGEFTETYSCTYTYDKLGNWTSKDNVYDGEEADKEERTITYY